MSQPSSYCKYCGARLAWGASFCQSCGRTIDVNQDSGDNISPTYRMDTNPAITRPGKSRTIWVALGSVILVFLIGTIAGFILRRGGLLGDSQSETVVVVEPSATPTNNESTPTQEVVKITPSDTPVPILPATETPEIPVSTPTSAVTFTEDVQPEEAPIDTTGSYVVPDRIFLADDFSDRELDWASTQNGQSYIQYHEGEVFSIALAEPFTVGFSFPQVIYPRRLQNVVVSVSGSVVDGGGYWGIRCRYVDSGNYYMLSVSDDYYRVAKFVDGEYIPITVPEWIQSESLDVSRYADGFIPITLKCIDNTIEFEVDSQFVDIIFDDTHTSGDYDIYAASGDVIGDVEGYYIKVLFDNFGMYEP